MSKEWMTEVDPWRPGLSFIEQDEPQANLRELTAEECWQRFPHICERIVRERIEELERQVAALTSRLSETAKAEVLLQIRHEELERQGEFRQIVAESKLPDHARESGVLQRMVSLCKSADQLRGLLRGLEELYRVGPQSQGKSLDF